MSPTIPAPVIAVPRVASRDDASACPSFMLEGLDAAPAPEAATRVRFGATRDAFVVLFESAAEPPLTLERSDGEDVFRDECVELFLCAPGERFAYREFVVNARGAVYAARIENPHDSRETWSVVPEKPPAEAFIEVKGDPATSPPSGWTRWTCLLSVPWSSLPGGLPPVSGEERRGNAYRIARGRSTRFLALSPTFRSAPPDFHVPSRFARFVFAGEPG